MSNKQQQWVERLARFEQAQQSVAAFCAAEGVSVTNFYLWKRRLANTTTPATLTPTLVPIQITTPVPVPTRTDVIELVLPSGAVIRFPVTITPAHLTATIHAWEARAR